MDYKKSILEVFTRFLISYKFEIRRSWKFDVLRNLGFSQKSPRSENFQFWSFSQKPSTWEIGNFPYPRFYEFWTQMCAFSKKACTHSILCGKVAFLAKKCIFEVFVKKGASVSNQKDLGKAREGPGRPPLVVEARSNQAWKKLKNPLKIKEKFNVLGWFLCSRHSKIKKSF